MDNVSWTRSTSRNKDDSCGGHVDVVRCFGRTIVTLYMTQAYELVIPIIDMSLYDVCDKN